MSRGLWIAFDVKGTLVGANAENVEKFLRWCQAQGHNVVVWSSLYSYAFDEGKRLGVACQEKRRAVPGVGGEPTFDVAVDDEVHGSAWLAADSFIWAQHVDADESKYADLIKNAIKKKDLVP